MADQTVTTEAAKAEKVQAAAAEAPAEAKAKPEAKPAEKLVEAIAEPAETKAVEAKPAAKVAEAKRPAKAAASRRVTKAKRAATPAKAAKVKPVRKPAVKRKKKPARAGATRIKGANTMTKQTNGIDAGILATEQFKTVFGDVNERAKAAVERSAKIVEELADLTRGNVEAIVASSKVAAKGVETLGQDAAEYGRKSFEEASAALKSFAEVKSATDLFKLQGDFARAAFDSAVAESARLSETMLKLAGDVVEPINSRYTVAAERVKTLAA
jgi:phasin family protein